MNPTATHRPRARALCGLALSLAAATFAGAALAAGDPAAGAKKGYTCLGCHGVPNFVNAYPTYQVPLIAGQNAEYLAAALRAYRAKEREHPSMQANAGLLSDEDIEDISAWFAAQGGATP